MGTFNQLKIDYFYLSMIYCENSKFSHSKVFAIIICMVIVTLIAIKQVRTCHPGYCLTSPPVHVDIKSTPSHVL